jgi:hypothetical protein
MNASRSQPSVDMTAGTSAFRRASSHGAPRGTGVGRAALRFGLALATPHDLLEIGVFRGAFIDIRSPQSAYLRTSARRADGMAVSRRASGRAASQLLAVEGFSRSSRRDRASRGPFAFLLVLFGPWHRSVPSRMRFEFSISRRSSRDRYRRNLVKSKFGAGHRGRGDLTGGRWSRTAPQKEVCAHEGQCRGGVPRRHWRLPAAECCASASPWRRRGCGTLTVVRSSFDKKKKA